MKKNEAHPEWDALDTLLDEAFNILDSLPKPDLTEAELLALQEIREGIGMSIERPANPSPQWEQRQDGRFTSFDEWNAALDKEWNGMYAELEKRREEVKIKRGDIKDKDTLIQARKELFSSVRPGEASDQVSFTQEELKENLSQVAEWENDLLKEKQELQNMSQELAADFDNYTKHRHFTKLYIHQLEAYGKPIVDSIKDSVFLHTDITEKRYAALLNGHTPTLQSEKEGKMETETDTPKKICFADQVGNGALTHEVYFKKGSMDIDMYEDKKMTKNWVKQATKNADGQDKDRKSILRNQNQPSF